MSTILVNESNLNFILVKEQTFLPEKEDFYQQMSSRHSIKVCDIIYLFKPDELLIIEVKSSSPKNNPAFVSEIKEKFSDSLLLYIATWANRPNTPNDNLPTPLKAAPALQRKIRLVLIVRDHKPEWLSPLREQLRKVCLPLQRLFSLEEIHVYNQDLARRKLALSITEDPS